MGVDMLIYAGASYFAYVYAYVEAAGVKYLPQVFPSGYILYATVPKFAPFSLSFTNT
jgi:hypothetical protein